MPFTDGLQRTYDTLNRVGRRHIVATALAMIGLLSFSNIKSTRTGRQLDTGIAEMIGNPLLQSKLFPLAKRPFNLQPFYHRAQVEVNDDEITLCTHLDTLRIQRLPPMAQDWRAPISVIVHLHPDESRLALDKILEDKDVKQFVDVHLLVDGVDRQLNLWRNIARMLSRSRYILQVDGDFSPTRNIQKQRKLLSRLDSEKIMFVLPAFEFVKNHTHLRNPTTKQELLGMRQKLQTFHYDWPRAHSPSDYQKWTTATEPYPVTQYNYHYEPYAVMLQTGPPWCDERFIGYGANKAACFYDAHLMNYKFIVLPNDFVVHVDHAYSIERGIERKVNRRFYEVFRDERCLQVNRMRQPMALTTNTLNDEVNCIAYGRSTLSEGVIQWREKSVEELVKMETEAGGSIF
jgi:hypothetical protein